jgi:hypothetical protein
MALLPATVVDVDALWRTTWTAALAGVAVCFVFSITVLGATRSSDMRRDDRDGTAAAFALVALVGLLATLAIVAYGVSLITTK